MERRYPDHMYPVFRKHKLKAFDEVAEALNDYYKEKKITQKQYLLIHEFRHWLKDHIHEVDDVLCEVDEQCPGEAHTAEVAGHIDNCMLCAPLWSVVLKEEFKKK